MKFLFKIIILTILVTSCKKQDKNKVFTKEKIKIEVIKEVEKLILSDKLKLTKVRLKCRGKGTRAASVFGSGVTIYFTIKNTSKLGVRNILFSSNFKFKGRDYLYSDEINYEFRKGLEPGEVLNVAMRPTSYSDWNSKIKPGEKGVLTLEIIEIEDYAGNIYE